MLSSLRHEQDAHTHTVSNVKFPHSSRIYMAREEYTDRLCQVAFVHFQFMKEAIIFFTRCDYSKYKSAGSIKNALIILIHYFLKENTVYHIL